MVTSLAELMHPNEQHAIACGLCSRYIAKRARFIATTRANPSRVAPACLPCGHAGRVCVACQREVTPDTEHLLRCIPARARADGVQLPRRVHALCSVCYLDKGVEPLARCWWSEMLEGALE